MSTLPYRQVQAVSPSCVDVYGIWMRRNRLQQPAAGRSGVLVSDIEAVPGAPPGVSLLWIGNRHTAKKFVLFFHGGGFYIALGRGHLDWFCGFMFWVVRLLPIPL